VFCIENSHDSCFSDDSDEPSGNLIHLPRRLLAGTACKKVKRVRTAAGKREENDSSDEDDDLDSQATGGWSRKDPALVGSKIPDFSTIELPEDVVEAAQGYNAYDYYKLFQPDSYAEMVVEQSKLYGGQKDLLKAAAQVDLDTYRYILLNIYCIFLFRSKFITCLLYLHKSTVFLLCLHVSVTVTFCHQVH
jgi:hypothetical protein